MFPIERVVQNQIAALSDTAAKVVHDIAKEAAWRRRIGFQEIEIKREMVIDDRILRVIFI
jgi:hypothetical protein